MRGLAPSILKHRASARLSAPEIEEGDMVVSVGRDNRLGCAARVVGVTGSATKQGKKYAAAFSTRVECAREPAFVRRAIAKARGQEQWHLMGRAASLVNIPSSPLGAITASVRVKVPNTKRDEISIITWRTRPDLLTLPNLKSHLRSHSHFFKVWLLDKLLRSGQNARVSCG